MNIKQRQRDNEDSTLAHLGLFTLYKHHHTSGPLMTETEETLLVPYIFPIIMLKGITF